MGTKRYNPRTKNAETLVVEWLKRTGRKTLDRHAFEACSFYWHRKGVLKQGETYARAFRRMREFGLVSAGPADYNGKIPVFDRPPTTSVVINHQKDKDGRYYRSNSLGW